MSTISIATKGKFVTPPRRSARTSFDAVVRRIDDRNGDHGMTSGYAHVNGQEIYYEVHGEGRPLV